MRWLFGRQYDSSSGAKGTGRSGAAISLRRAFQRAERLAADQRDHLVAQPLHRPALLHHQQPARLAHRFQDRAEVHRLEHEGVPDLDRAGAAGGHRQRLVDHRPEGHQRQIGPFGVSPRPPHRFQVAVEIDLAALAPVEQLVLEDQARIGIVEAGHQGLERLLGGGRIEQFQPGEPRPQPLELARVKRPHRQPAAAGQPQQQRRGPAGAEVPRAGVQCRVA